jgi:large subunit ribosomal protein L25
MSQDSNLNIEIREKVGSRDARKLRRVGRTPASLQTDGEKPHLNIHLDREEFLTSRRRNVHLYDLVSGKDTEAALIRELQWDSLGDNILHIEFKRVQRGVKTEAEVQLEFTGHPLSGILNHLVTHVTVITLPSQIPDSIEVRVNDLDVGGHIRASDLELPEGVSLAVPEDLEIAVVSAVKGDPETPEEGAEDGDETPIEGADGETPGPEGS